MKDKSGKSEEYYELLRHCFEHEWDLARDVLRKNPRVLNEESLTDETPLFYLAVENQMKAVEFLKDEGADINACDSFGNSPLTICVTLGHLELAELLFDWGASTLQTNMDDDDLLCLLESGPKVSTQRPDFESLRQMTGGDDLDQAVDSGLDDTLRGRFLEILDEFEKECPPASEFSDPDVTRDDQLERIARLKPKVRARWEEEIAKAPWPRVETDGDEDFLRPIGQSPVGFFTTSARIRAHIHPLSPRHGDAKLLRISFFDSSGGTPMAKASLAMKDGTEVTYLLEAVKFTPGDELSVETYVNAECPVIFMDCRWMGYGPRVGFFADGEAADERNENIGGGLETIATCEKIIRQNAD